MALSSFVGSFNTGVGAAASTVAITGVGFTPEAILFWWSGRTESTDTVGRASHYRGFGVALSSTSRAAITSSSIDAQASSDTQRGHDEASCILSVDATPAIDGQMDFVSMDADGFTLVVDTQMPRSLRVHYLALGGDSLTNTNLGRFTAAGTPPVDQDVTGVGFQPDFVLFFSTIPNNPPALGAHSTVAIGAAVSSTAQGAWFGSSFNAQGTMSTGSYCTAGECFALGTGTAVTERADFVSFLADGFRINWVERGNANRVFYLALKGGNYAVGNLLTQTDTVTDIVETGFGFQPTSALFVSHGQAESTSDTIQANDRLSIGAFFSTSVRGAQATLDEHNTADSEVTTAIEFDSVYANIASDSTIAGLMDVKSVDSDGFTMIMDDADPAQAFVWYMAFGPPAADVPQVAASETVTLSETVAVVISTAQVSVSETITLTEAASVSVAISVSVSETITLTEATTENLVSLVSASETVTLLETVSQQLGITVATAETITLTETAAVVVSNPQVSVSETITLDETAALNLVAFISASETVTLSETVSQEILITLAASETIALTEGVTVAPILLPGVSVGETITLTELATVAIMAVVGAAIMPDNAAYARWRDKRAIARSS